MTRRCAPRPDRLLHRHKDGEVSLWSLKGNKSTALLLWLSLCGPPQTINVPVCYCGATRTSSLECMLYTVHCGRGDITWSDQILTLKIKRRGERMMETDSNVIHFGRYKYHSKTLRSCYRIVIGWKEQRKSTIRWRSLLNASVAQTHVLPIE